ncbi:hypothetical protein [Methyloglobulus sp.]|uniref:hypothetical protein n=1 Tax=Methyloglobulus sp. TaxID=2518622 RepID=UPI003988C60F
MNQKVMVGRGKAIFDGRVEYPLPTKSGTKDFIFYFVPSSNGYGKGARSFFDRFYKNHVRKEVRSLEDMIVSLHSEVSGGITQIREIVMVAHGTRQGMVLPVFAAASGTNLQEYRNVSAFSIALLQKDFSDGKFVSVQQKRTAVIARLLDDSWVTIRACRVGSSAECLYALYSFFGGRANVYAPTEYQFFGSHPIMSGMRAESRLEAHHHLVKQRFFPGDEHTPERQDAIVQFLTDRAMFTEPFQLASTPFDNPATEYEVLIDGLNARKIDPTLKQRFSDLNHPLSGNARVHVIQTNTLWLIKDEAEHADTKHTIQYDVGELIVFEGSERQAALVASASLMDVESARDSLPLQLFFYEGEHELWKGKLFQLAAYAEEVVPNPELKQKFDAVLALLKLGNFSDGDVNIRTEFKENLDVDLSGAAQIQTLSASGSGPTEKITWAIQDQERYVVKLEHPATDQGIAGHSITVYKGLQGQARLREEYALMSLLGQDPDTPGTELAAYLDRFSIEELMLVIDDLRKPYRPVYSFYIHHAQQAIARKKDYFTWWMEQYGTLLESNPLFEQPHAELSRSESEDKHLVVHDFSFNNIWREVKVSHPTLSTFQNDLFAEENLWEKLGRELDELNDRNAGPQLEADSPFTDLEELRQLQRQGLEPFFSTDKATLELEEVDDLSCEEFAAVINRWKELQGADPEEIKRLLGLETTADGKTFLDHVMFLYDKYKIANIGLGLFNIAFMRDGLAVRIVEKLPWFAPSAGTLAIIEGTPTIIGVTHTIIGRFLRIAPTITIPLTMWGKFLEAQIQTLKVWENTGRLTAMRQWLRELISLTVRDPFPSDLPIDLHDQSKLFLPGAHLEIARYYQEQVDESGEYSVFVFAQEEMSEGFEDGIQVMEEVGMKIVDYADEVVGDLMRGWDLEDCMMKVLKDAGIVDLNLVRRQIIRELARQLLNELPKV